MRALRSWQHAAAHETLAGWAPHDAAIHETPLMAKGKRMVNHARLDAAAAYAQQEEAQSELDGLGKLPKSMQASSKKQAMAMMATSTAHKAAALQAKKNAHIHYYSVLVIVFQLL